MPHAVNRRGFIQAAGAGLAGAALTGRASGGIVHRRAPDARNVIFMVSDGMSTGTLTLADSLRRAETGRPSAWVALFSDRAARRSICTTHAADSMVTDSAASASAWSIGLKVNNGAINFTPDGAQPEPILVTARRAGLATGLVTTTRITHATPAGFVANVPSRGMERPIAAQTLERGIDVILGGGAKHFPDDLLAQHPQYTLARTAQDLTNALASAPADAPLLGLFADDHIPYVLDREPTVPSLADMTRAALPRLARAAGGFIVQVEGGRVDHAAHANDAGSLLREQLDFDDALAVALEFTLARTDTLLVVTTDHGTANPGLTLYDQPGNDGFERLARAARSFEWLSGRIAAAGGWHTARPTLAALVAEMTGGIELNPADLEWLDHAVGANQRNDGFWARSRDANCALGSVLANHYGVSFLSPNHTSDMVEVTAIGPGAERLAPVIDNTNLHALLLASLRIATP